MPQISLCMIARDEEASVARCLESVAGFADEMVVVDTGSVDRTCDICRAHGARVHSFAWTDDFSAARNFGLERATGDWILWLDADEWLSLHDPAALRARLDECAAQALFLPMRHFYGGAPADDKRVYLSSAIRLFRRDAGLTFRGRIHERLESMDGDAAPHAEQAGGAEIMHDGCMEKSVAQKSERNLALLVREWSEGGDDLWIASHIAVELHRLSEFADSYRLVNAAIAGFLKKDRMPPAHLYQLKYQTLVMTGNAEAAHPGIERAVELYPDDTDLHFYKGLILLNLGRHQEAAEAFECCLVLGDGNPKYLSMLGVGSFFALYYLGVCREAKGEREAARIAYHQALALDPASELFRFSCERLA